MRFQRLWVALGAVVCVWGADSLQAHHSMAMYDTQKTISITGVVRLFQMKNPHSVFYVMVADGQGKESEWVLESQPLSHLLANGWHQSTLKVGDKITAVGAPARNGKNAMLVRAIQLPDGRSLGT